MKDTKLPQKRLVEVEDLPFKVGWWITTIPMDGKSIGYAGIITEITDTHIKYKVFGVPGIKVTSKTVAPDIKLLFLDSIYDVEAIEKAHQRRHPYQYGEIIFPVVPDEQLALMKQYANMPRRLKKTLQQNKKRHSTHAMAGKQIQLL